MQNISLTLKYDFILKLMSIPFNYSNEATILFFRLHI